MRDILANRLEDLKSEAQSLVEQRERMLNAIQEMEIRLHQISGAITEIDQLLRTKGDEDEAGKVN